MAALAVSAATGALKPLLEKLATELCRELKRFNGVPDEVRSLTKELGAMEAYLQEMSELEDPDAQDRDCMKEVRELSYDMEDSVDEFLLRVAGGGEEAADGPGGPIARLKNALVDKPRTRHKIARVIEGLKAQVREMGERNARYRAHETVSKASNAGVDGRALAMFEEASRLIGLDGPRNELVEVSGKTKKSGSAPSLPAKVLSIVGCGGSGKTTLANQVYRVLKGEFECHAFVSVSRNPIMEHVLQNILCQVDDTPHHNIQAWNMQTLIIQINGFLKDKRYLIVIDDIWTKDAWKTINCALYKNDQDNRIITTTRKYDVAEACCSSDGDFVYEMKPLGPADSRRLFLERLFGSEDKFPTNLTRIANKILEKCDGLPLAIISIAGLLSSKAPTEDEWVEVQSYIGRGIAKDPGVKTMMQILSLSYFDLPHHLKTCLLYLSMFPEDHIIDKKHLVRRWIAEGFIPREPGQTLYELGERCFNELINRSLIQARNMDMYGEVRACQVHDTVLDFIVSRSEEENFVTVFRDDGHMPGPDSKVRRLSLHACSKAKASTLTELNLAHVRSVTVFAFEELPSWSKFRFLRVLDLQGCKQVEGGHLAGIGNLFQLKYLSLRETGVSELPEQIWKLKSLETLDLKKSKVKRLPAGISLLTRLVYLVVDKGVKLPDGTERMKALEDLGCVDVFKQSVDFPREFGQLENLRNVRLFLSSGKRSTPAEGTRYKEYLSNMASSLCKLGRLRSLSVKVDPESSEDFSLDSAGDVPASLRRFQVTGHFLSKVPNWAPSLVNLQCLTLHVKAFEAQDLMALGRLPILVFLRLVAHESFQGTTSRVTISGADGFPKLRRFDYGCATPVRFEAGAMPEIKKLILLFSYFKASWAVRNTDFFLYPVGIQHLTSLDSVCCLLYCKVQEVVDWIAEKRTLMADMSCKQVKATVGEMGATAEQMFMKSESLMETAARAHLKCSELTIRITTQWGMRNEGSRFKSPFTDRLVSMLRTSEASLMLARQVREMMSNCPLKGKGNCQCQGVPEAIEQAMKQLTTLVLRRFTGIKLRERRPHNAFVRT
ncbi:hypothetical protein PAHAL_2G055300 [Panicum hallii]|uniref:AAA+ ATPase domain-containing protein n=1 Tax=Panicum hallii TaxID=206008 RepID=A0A2T8KMZ0_9POAL|nr:hypothetical protein PAHAL_2G055300 [Panicum hallii]